MQASEKSLVYRATIEGLAAAASAAIKTKNADDFTSVCRQLQSLSAEMSVPSELRDLASKLHDDLALDMTDAGLAAMESSVSKLKGATTQLQAAVDDAKKGKAGLSVPKLAQAADKAVKSFNSFKAEADNVQKDLRQAKGAELKDLPTKLKSLVADLDELRKTAKTS